MTSHLRNDCKQPETAQVEIYTHHDQNKTFPPLQAINLSLNPPALTRYGFAQELDQTYEERHRFSAVHCRAVNTRSPLSAVASTVD